MTSIKGYWVPSRFAARGQHSELQNQQKHLRDKWGFPIHIIIYWTLLTHHLYRTRSIFFLLFFLGGHKLNPWVAVFFFPGNREVSRCFGEFDLWNPLQSELGRGHTAQQVAKASPGRCIQSAHGPGEVAQHLTVFGVGRCL